MRRIVVYARERPRRVGVVVVRSGAVAACVAAVPRHVHVRHAGCERRRRPASGVAGENGWQKGRHVRVLRLGRCHAVIRVVHTPARYARGRTRLSARAQERAPDV